MTIRNLERLLAPRSVAFVGASPEPRTVGSIVAHNLLRGGFAGPIWLVNPRHRSIDGVSCFASLADLPEAPDLVVVATPPGFVPAIIADAGARGTRAAVIITAGIGGALRQSVLDAARPYCLRIQGPNCLGLLRPAHRPQRQLLAPHAEGRRPCVRLAVGRARHRHYRLGGVARHRLSQVVSLGDMADADFGDMLDYLAGDTNSRAILIYMERSRSAEVHVGGTPRRARPSPSSSQGRAQRHGGQGGPVPHGRFGRVGCGLQGCLPPGRRFARARAAMSCSAPPRSWRRRPKLSGERPGHSHQRRRRRRAGCRSPGRPRRPPRRALRGHARRAR